MPAKGGRAAITKAAGVALALLIWLLASSVNHRLLLASPIDVVKRLVTIWREPGFFDTIAHSLSRIVGGFVLALIFGSLLAGLASRYRTVEALMWPYVVTIKSVPVASFIIIALIWLGAGQLSIFISFLMVFPIIYSNVLSGVSSTDKGLLEMARLFRVSGAKRLKYIYLPQLRPFLLGACGSSLGIAWKAGVAAEVIGIPPGSMGERLYEAKIYLSTVDLFAWTAIIVIMSVLFEKLFMRLMRAAFSGLEKL